jgi:transposase
MEKRLQTPQSVGIDVAKAKIDVCILRDMTETESKQFPNESEKDMGELIHWLTENRVQEDTPIIVESTGSYHWLSCLLLSEHGFQVHLINPLITKRYERSSIRGAKTDTVDAKRLAEMGVIEKDLPLFFDSRESLSAKKYHSLYAKIQKVKQQLSRSYTDAVESAESVGISLNLDSIKDCLDQIEETLKTLKKIIEENVSEEAIKLAEIKGVSKFQASVLCNATEGRTFENKNQLIAFFGLDIKKKESGTWRGREKLSKRGNSFYRMVLFQLGWSLSRNNAEFKEYYERLRKDGRHYYTCLIATARKFLRFFFAHFLKSKLASTFEAS